MRRLMGTMGSSTASASTSSCRTFPPPLRVLLVEHDRTCLLILKRMLLLCNYKVTSCRDAEEAQSLIQSNKDSFDIALCEVHLPGPTGLELLDAVVHQTDIPVVMISSDLSDDVVRRAMERGARDYLAKPVRMHSLEHLWRHLLGKERWRSYIAKINGDTHELIGKHKKVKEEIIGTSRSPEGVMKAKEEFADGDDEEEPRRRRRRELTVSSKKPRFSWTPELHWKFVSAVEQLGTNAFPKSIVQVMGVPDLTARQVASHLQQYKRTLKKATPPVAIASSTPLAENSPVAAMMSRRAGLVQHQSHQSSPVIGLGIDGTDEFLMHQSNASGSFTLPSFGDNHEGGSFYQDNYQMNHGFADGQDYNLVPAQYVNGCVITDTDTNLVPYVGSGGEATMGTDNNSKALTLYQSSQVGTSQSMVTNIYDDSDEFIQDLLNMYWYN